MMCFSTTMFATLLTAVRAFTLGSLTPFAYFRASTTTTARFLSSSPLPYDENKMPFYALGTNLARQVGEINLKALLEEDELDIVIDAFCANLRGTVPPDDARKILSTYGQELNTLLKDRTSLITDRVRQEGETFATNFLDSNAEATKRDSGLVYCEITAGTGASPTIDSTVEVHYHGTLTDGTVVDSSVDRGETVSFPLNGVIKGWAEGLQLMKEGGKATLIIPSDLAYGDAGSGEVIPPGATLKFEVQLLKVSNSEPHEEEIIELPDGTKMRVPKGVKMRMVEEE